MRRRDALLWAVPALAALACSSSSETSSLRAADESPGANPGSSSGGGAAPTEPAPEKEVESDYEAPVATGKFVWIANPKSGRVAYVDAATLQVKTVEAGNARPPHATVEILTPDEQTVTGEFSGDGPVDAVFRAINSATGIDVRLREFRVGAVTGGQDALGEVTVVVELGADGAPIRSDLPGTTGGDRVTGAGQGVATDIIEAAAIAYVRALGNAAARASAVVDAEIRAAETP